jgi:hypothetical protein
MVMILHKVLPAIDKCWLDCPTSPTMILIEIVLQRDNGPVPFGPTDESWTAVADVLNSFKLSLKEPANSQHTNILDDVLSFSPTILNLFSAGNKSWQQ